MITEILQKNLLPLRQRISSTYASYQYDRNSRLLSGGSKNNFDYSKMKGQQVELRTIIQNLSDTQTKTVTLRLWVEHSNGDKSGHDRWEAGFHYKGV